MNLSTIEVVSTTGSWLWWYWVLNLILRIGVDWVALRSWRRYGYNFGLDDVHVSRFVFRMDLHFIFPLRVREPGLCKQNEKKPWRSGWYYVRPVVQIPHHIVILCTVLHHSSSLVACIRCLINRIEGPNPNLLPLKRCVWKMWIWTGYYLSSWKQTLT